MQLGSEPATAWMQPASPGFRCEQPALHLVWAFEGPVAEPALQEIEWLGARLPVAYRLLPVFVHCGSRECMAQIHRLASKDVQSRFGASFLELRMRAMGTPLHEFVVHNPYYKWRLKASFEQVVQEVALLSLANSCPSGIAVDLASLDAASMLSSAIWTAPDP